jgi:hypothetical protein
MGTCHLIGKALDELKTKGIRVDEAEYLAARMAALLHDIGHGPFSHSLENLLVSVPHETISKILMEKMNEEFNGLLAKALMIFEHNYPRTYLHQLVSSQLDVDRMDYLNRDSFYTGVSEGVIGYDRILQMLSVKDNELVVEEKGVHSVEKFIIARRLMYWQVYLHKTVLSAEMLLVNIIKRAKELARDGFELFATPVFKYFLYNNVSESDFRNNPEVISNYCGLDDSDVFASIKVWQTSSDPVLSKLCKMLILRNLYKISFVSESLAENLRDKKDYAETILGIDKAHLHYFVFTGIASNNTYNVENELIRIETKSGLVRNISEIEDSLVNQTIARSVHKHYICYIK